MDKIQILMRSEAKISCVIPFLWASLVAQTVKHLPVVRETQVQFLSWEDPMEKEMATHPSTLAWQIPFAY